MTKKLNNIEMLVNDYGSYEYAYGVLEGDSKSSQDVLNETRLKMIEVKKDLLNAIKESIKE